MTIGLIAEGVTDQVTITNILVGYFDDKTLQVNELQPKRSESGNWDKVFKYCSSADFRQALPFNDLLIIQLDIDIFRRGELPKDLKIDIKDMGPSDIVSAVKEKLIQNIGEDFYNQHSNQIIFAIAVDEIECWFLPIYYPNKQSFYSKTTSCIQTLNKVLQNKEGFYIDAKKEDYYRKMSKHFHKKKDLETYASKNPSLRIFIDELNIKWMAVQKEINPPNLEYLDSN